MRIDFHTHTKKCKSGDGSSRTISPEKYIKKMEDNDVVMCAITNHNKFSKSEFEKIENLEHNFTIFPGIELDVLLNQTIHHHIILICDPSEKNNFYTCFDNDSNRNYDEFTMSYDDLIRNITLD